VLLEGGRGKASMKAREGEMVLKAMAARDGVEGDGGERRSEEGSGVTGSATVWGGAVEYECGRSSSA